MVLKKIVKSCNFVESCSFQSSCSFQKLLFIQSPTAVLQSCNFAVNQVFTSNQKKLHAFANGSINANKTIFTANGLFLTSNDQWPFSNQPTNTDSSVPQIHTGTSISLCKTENPQIGKYQNFDFNKSIQAFPRRNISSDSSKSASAHILDAYNVNPVHFHPGVNEPFFTCPGVNDPFFTYLGANVRTSGISGRNIRHNPCFGQIVQIQTFRFYQR